MRTRVLVVAAVAALPFALSAQVLPRPRRGLPVPESPPEPTPTPVTRALEYQRSRWSSDGYMMASSIMLPSATGRISRYATLGTGVHSDYRVTDAFTGTADITLSPFGGTAMTTTAEVGGRYRPGTFEDEVRPFVDVRGAFLRMYDSFSAPIEGSGGIGIPPEYATNARYSRGLGGIGGAGLEFAVTPTLAMTTEVTALRGRLTTYSSNGPSNLPTGTSYWMTTVRYALGFRYNPGHFTHSSNNPR